MRPVHHIDDERIRAALRELQDKTIKLESRIESGNVTNATGNRRRGTVLPDPATYTGDSFTLDRSAQTKGDALYERVKDGNGNWIWLLSTSIGAP